MLLSVMLVILVKGPTPDVIYYSMEEQPSALECELAKEEFLYRATLTRTLDDIIYISCIPS